MQLDDLIEEQSIESIAKKTNIAEGVIRKLFNKEFKTLNLPQALGALSIIEREYSVDLNALRQECKAYFEDNGSQDSVVASLTPIKRERRTVSRLMVFVLLAMLAYAAWYFFAGYYKQKIIPLDTKSEKSLLNTILQGNEIASKDVKQDVSGDSVPDAEEVVVRDNEATDSAGKSVADQSSETKQNVHTAASETSAVEESREANQSTVPAVPEASIEEQNDTIQTVEAIKTLEDNDSALQVPVTIVRETMTLLPQEVMWFRLIELDTKKRREFKRKERYEIDLKGQDWLFATENAHFAIIDGDRFEEFSGEGKLFFKLDQDGINQLSEDDYRALEK